MLAGVREEDQVEFEVFVVVVLQNFLQSLLQLAQILHFALNANFLFLLHEVTEDYVLLFCTPEHVNFHLLLQVGLENGVELLQVLLFH